MFRNGSEYTGERKRIRPGWGSRVITRTGGYDRRVSDDRLHALAAEAAACTRCPQLVAARTQVVFGTGDRVGGVLLVGEAPGPAEDAAGLPLTGRAAELLADVLAEAGVGEEATCVTTAVKCRTPDNRAPSPGELSACRDWLERQVETLAPVVVCPLGSVATKLLRGDPAPVTRVHGEAEVQVVGGRAVRLLPLLHPAAALYRPDGVERLRRDVALLPGLLALGPPAQPEPPAPEPEPDAITPPAEPPTPGQLGLF